MRAGENTTGWGNVRGRGGDRGSQVRMWLGTIAQEGRDGETTLMGDAGAGKTSGGCGHLGG